eukprot:scaffold114664_cov36-Prasinocladus_malaysianus.AAC.2
MGNQGSLSRQLVVQRTYEPNFDPRCSLDSSANPIRSLNNVIRGQSDWHLLCNSYCCSLEPSVQRYECDSINPLETLRRTSINRTAKTVWEYPPEAPKWLCSSTISAPQRCATGNETDCFVNHPISVQQKSKCWYCRCYHEHFKNYMSVIITAGSSGIMIAI